MEKPKPPRPTVPSSPRVPTARDRAANAALEQQARTLRRQSSPEIEELEAEIDATIGGLAKHLAAEHKIRRASDRLLVLLARANGLGDFIPFELKESKPPPALESDHRGPLLPRIQHDVQQIKKEQHVSQQEKLVILISNAVFAAIVLSAWAFGKLDMGIAMMMLAGLSLPGGGSVLWDTLKKRAASKAGSADGDAS